MIAKDLTGQKYGKLTVLKRIIDDDKKKVKWLCQCECGNQTIVIGDHLKNGHTRSCGCLFKEVGKANKKYNTYKFIDNVGYGYTSKNEIFIFDKEDYDKIKNYCWSITHNKKGGYVMAYDSNLKKKIMLHRLIINCPPNMMVDHINHNKADNRKENLRLCNNQQNSMNHKISKRNTSGYTGVHWSNKSQKWESTLFENGNHHYLGRYDDIEEAVRVRREAELDYFGEFAINESFR